MVARDFARHGFPLWRPQVAWLGGSASGPRYFSAEFPIQSAIAAMLYGVFGENDTLARCVTVAFSLMGICCLYDLLRRRAGESAALLGAFIYSLFPHHLFFGRVFMPDIPAISLALAALDALDRWTENRKTSWLLGSAAVTAAAVLQKLTVIFVGLPVLYLLATVYGEQLWKRRETYIFALIAGIPVLVWYGHSIAMAGRSVFAMDRGLFGAHLGLWLQRPFSAGVVKALAVETLSPVGTGLVLLGFVWPAKDRAAWIFRLWLGGAVLLLLVMPGVLPNNHYYLALLLPGAAALAGLSLAALAQNRSAYPALAVILAAFVFSSINSVRPLYEPDRLPYDLGRLLNELAEPPDLLVTETGWNPNVLYWSNRHGWLLEREYRWEKVQSLALAGARYYADVFPADANRQRSFFQDLDGRFQRLTADDAPWRIYDLRPAIGVSRTFAEGEIRTPQLVNFGNEIELRGISLRPLVDWPAVFEVVYYWRCVKTPATELRVFVHITDSSGRTVYQQDHWPQSGRFPTSAWKPGDLIRERYVLTLPGSLSGGTYQVRLGWFDPVRGNRVPILHPGRADAENRAIAAELVILPAPREGWFGMQ